MDLKGHNATTEIIDREINWKEGREQKKRKSNFPGTFVLSYAFFFFSFNLAVEIWPLLYCILL